MTAKNTTTATAEKETAPETKSTKAKATASNPFGTGAFPVDYKNIVKQSLEYNRKGFETIFDAVESFQGKAEEYTDKALEQYAYIPEEGKVQLRKWIEAGRKARTGFRTAVLQGHDKLEKWLAA